MEEIKKSITSILEDDKINTEYKLLSICQTLDSNFPDYNWTGFYFTVPGKDELELGPYVGEETEHTLIPFGKGICGQVAASGKTFNVPDVGAEDNYISCSIATKSELVVPIFKNGENIGQIDIDSHQPNTFGKGDEDLLEWIAGQVSKIL